MKPLARLKDAASTAMGRNNSAREVDGESRGLLARLDSAQIERLRKAPKDLPEADGRPEAS